MIDEGNEIASTRAEKYEVSILGFWLDILDLGVSRASEKARARRESERGYK